MISETITIDAAPAIGELDALASAADKAAASLDKIKTSALGGGGADKLAASMAAAADRIEQASQRAAAAMGRLSTAGRAATGNLDSLGRSADAAGAGLDRAAAGADASAAAMDRMAVAGERAGKAGAAAAGGAKFWDGLKTVLLGAGIAAAYGIDKAMKFNAEVTRLYTAAGLTHAPFQQVSQDLLKIGTQTGFTGVQIAQAMYHPVSAGLNLATSLGLVTQAANLANIHGANLEDTTYALSSVMKAYNLGVKQVIPTAALLNSIVGQGDMRFQDFNESVKNWTPTSAQMGISIQSAGAALAYLTDRGNSAEVASTRLTMGLTMMAVPSKQAGNMLIGMGVASDKVKASSDAMRQAMEAAHITTNRLAADLRKPDGIYVALTDLKTSLEKAGVSGAQADSVMTKIFGGGRSDKAMMSLMQNLDGVKQKYDQISQGVAGYGASVAKEQATAQQKWNDFKAGMQNLATGFGTTLLPYFTSLAGEADKFLGFLSRSKGATDGLVAGLGGLAALFTGKKLVSGVESAFQTGETALRGIGKMFGIPGLKNLGQGAGLDGAAGALKGSAGSLSGAAADLSAAAGKLAGEGGLGGAAGAAGKAEGAAAGAEGAAAGAGAARLKSAGATAGLGVLATATLVDPWLKSLKNSQGNWLDNAFGTPKTSGWNSWSSFGHDLSTLWGLIPSGSKAPPPSVVPAGMAPAVYGRFGPIGATAAAPAPPSGGMALLGAGGHPASLAAPDLSALTAAKAKAASEAEALTKSVDTALKKPVKAAPPDLSAYTSAAGKARADGLAMSAGLASGIEAGKGAAVAAAADVASAAAAAMGHAIQARSPSKVTQKIGASMVEGLIVGLQGGQAALTAEAAALGKITAKAADVAAIDAAISKAESYAGKDSAMVRWLKGEQGKLLGLAAKRTALEAEITGSQQIAQSAISGMSIMNAGAYTPASVNGPVSSYQTIQGLRYMAGDSKAFAAQLAQLKRMGLNPQSLSQLAQAGAASGLPIAQGLTQGGAGAISQVNALEKQITGSSSRIGDIGGPAMYQAGQQLAAGLAPGLKAALSGVGADMRQIADSVAHAVRSGHVPSGGRGGGAQTIVVKLVVDGRELASIVQDHTLERTNNNWQAGMNLPNRAK